LIYILKFVPYIRAQNLSTGPAGRDKDYSSLLRRDN